MQESFKAGAFKPLFVLTNGSILALQHFSGSLKVINQKNYLSLWQFRFKFNFLYLVSFFDYYQYNFVWRYIDAPRDHSGYTRYLRRFSPRRVVEILA